MAGYVNDMTSLADIVNPAAAAGQAGQQDQAAANADALKNQLSAGTLPADIQAAGLKNLFTQAQTAQEQATTQGTTLGNIEKAGTLGSTIGATNAGNQLKITSDQAAQLQQLGQYASQLAPIMAQAPAALRPVLMRSFLQKQGVDPESLGPIADGDPDVLNQVGQRMFEASQGARQTTLEKSLEGSNQAIVAGIQSSGRTQAAEITATGRVEAERMLAQVRQRQQSFEQAATAEYNANGATPKYKELAQRALEERQFAAQTNRVLLGMGDYSGSYGDQGGGAQPGPQGNGTPAPTANAAPTDALQQAATSAWGSYDPSKYDYRQDPQTGNIQRKAK
jgi:hypothetical protein